MPLNEDLEKTIKSREEELQILLRAKAILERDRGGRAPNPKEQESSKAAWFPAATNLFSDGKVHTIREVVEAVERAGYQPNYIAISSWLKRSVKQKRTLDSLGRGKYRLSKGGAKGKSQKEFGGAVRKKGVFDSMKEFVGKNPGASALEIAKAIYGEESSIVLNRVRSSMGTLKKRGEVQTVSPGKWELVKKE